MLIFHTHLHFFQGGSKMIFELSKKIRKNEKITLIIHNGKNEYIRLFEKERIHVMNLKSSSTNSVKYWLFLPFYVARESIMIINHVNRRKELQKEKIMTTTFPSHIVGYIVSKLTNLPYYTYCFEPYPFFYNKNFMWSNGLIKGILFIVIKYAYSWMDRLALVKSFGIFTLNKITQKTIFRIYHKRSIVTLMGVDTNHFKPSHNHKIEKKYKNHFVILHSTDYSRMKKTELAIQIFALVIKKIPNAILLITSTRPMVKEKYFYVNLIRNLNLKKQVHLLNYVPYKKLPVYYSLADCYLSCSYDEMLGTTSSNLPVKEAMACETPAIRSNITDEDVKDGISGYLVNPQDINNVSKTLVKFIQLPSVKKRAMGKAARRKIVSSYNWNFAAGKITEAMSYH